ncbi:ABC transporter ATP-binding protein [Phytoactinopolyspora limicola]|uniref:ABC transporter ATP-binding protein n=1 Tax=Phytoactinopolyspora limicola TaxID=2715536 RepID=UPI001407DE59|nr:ABC transporter ATP-binding protein [Phytoactinopolyspora limicola]
MNQLTPAEPVVVARDLVVDYLAAHGPVRALDGVDLAVDAGETVGVVGESGSGKSTLGAALGRLLPSRAERRHGSMHVAGHSVFDLAPQPLRQLRRDQLGFVFQDPIGALDPTMRVGAQVRRALRGRQPSPRRSTRDAVAALLDQVRLRDPARVARAYPHQLSGGMAQRVALAMAMAVQPRVLVADEPTAALDSQVRDEVLDTILALTRAAGTTVLWLSHDLNAVARRCARVVVMYGGRVVEDGPAHAVLARPAHPYTHALASSAPSHARPGERLTPIPGRPPLLAGPAPGCAFAERCRFVVDRCATERPPLARVNGQAVLCHRAEELRSTAALPLPARPTDIPAEIGGGR